MDTKTKEKIIGTLKDINIPETALKEPYSMPEEVQEFLEFCFELSLEGSGHNG